MNACANGEHDTVKHLLQNKETIHPEVIKDTFKQMCGTLGMQTIAQLILEHVQNDITIDDLNLATRYACEHGRLEIAQWLTDMYPTIDVNGWHKGWHFCDPVFYVTCLHGHLPVVQWLFRKQNISISDIKTSMSYICCHKTDDRETEERQCEVAEWLYSYVEVKDYIQRSDYLLIQLISIGNIPMLKWWIEKKPVFNDFVFCFHTSCLENQLEVAQWLLSLRPDFDVSINNEMIFCDVCFKGYLDIAKWLVQIKPTIRVHTRNHFAIKTAHNNQHHAVVDWLVELHPNMYKLTPMPPPSIRRCLTIYKVHEARQLPYGNPCCIIIINGAYETCSICTEYDCNVKLNCKHSFCKNCISTWYDKNNTCPLCRAEITSCVKLRRA